MSACGEHGRSLPYLSRAYRLRKGFLPRTFFCCLCEIEQVALLFKTDFMAALVEGIVALEKNVLFDFGKLIIKNKRVDVKKQT